MTLSTAEKQEIKEALARIVTLEALRPRVLAQLQTRLQKEFHLDASALQSITVDLTKQTLWDYAVERADEVLQKDLRRWARVPQGPSRPRERDRLQRELERELNLDASALQSITAGLPQGPSRRRRSNLPQGPSRVSPTPSSRARRRASSTPSSRGRGGASPAPSSRVRGGASPAPSS